MKGQGLMSDLDTLRAQVLSLPPLDREALMVDILASFDSGAREAVEKAWAGEIESRRKAYLEGRIGTVSLEESRRRMGH